MPAVPGASRHAEPSTPDRRNAACSIVAGTGVFVRDIHAKLTASSACATAILDPKRGAQGACRVQVKAGAPWEDRLVADLAATAIRLVSDHPAVLRVELAGSRSRGTHEELSDWDFAVTTSHFAAVARDLPALVAPLHPLGQQWEPLGHFPVYQLLLRGPAKVEYLFLDHSQQAMPAPTPGPATVDAINTHFWDWIWWIATKASIGRTELVDEHLRQLFGYLLRPTGVLEPPADIQAAIDQFVRRRDELERDYDITVSRALEEEVRAGIRRLGLAS